jgi:ubiquinone/menaquinone biosynthesis C-methylase UbiE
MLSTDDGRKTVLVHTFNEASAGYDCRALRFFADSANTLVSLLNLRGNERLLDVATGTGHVAVAAAQRLAHGSVVGTDISPDMLSCASRKAKTAGLHNISLEPMDMESLDFPDGSFDFATCGFGIFFVDDMESALLRIIAKVKPGGTIAITSFCEGFLQPLSDLFAGRLKSYGVAVPPRDSQKMTAREQCESLLRSAALTSIIVEDRDHSYFLRTAEEWWDVVQGTAFCGWLKRLPPGSRDDFRREHLKEIRALATHEGIWLPVRVHYARGRRASG